jgi:hypothetical protein
LDIGNRKCSVVNSLSLANEEILMGSFAFTEHSTLKDFLCVLASMSIIT